MDGIIRINDHPPTPRGPVQVLMNDNWKKGRANSRPIILQLTNVYGKPLSLEEAKEVSDLLVQAIRDCRRFLSLKVSNAKKEGKARPVLPGPLSRTGRAGQAATGSGVAGKKH